MKKRRGEIIMSDIQKPRGKAIGPGLIIREKSLAAHMQGRIQDFSWGWRGYKKL